MQLRFSHRHAAIDQQFGAQNEAAETGHDKGRCDARGNLAMMRVDVVGMLPLGIGNMGFPPITAAQKCHEGKQQHGPRRKP